MPGFSMATVMCSETVCPFLKEPIDAGASGQSEVEKKLRWGEMLPLWKEHWPDLIALDDGVWTESGVTAAQFGCGFGRSLSGEDRRGSGKATDDVEKIWASRFASVHADSGTNSTNSLEIKTMPPSHTHIQTHTHWFPTNIDTYVYLCVCVCAHAHIRDSFVSTHC